ncbi:MAG: triacylglycerol lipase [Ruminococcus sp.]|nr:triacylglycerol lipase [Ruminococcus sp.]
MRKINIILYTVIVLLFSGIVSLWVDPPFRAGVKVILTIGAVLLYFGAVIIGLPAEGGTSRLRRLKRGSDMILAGGISAVLAAVMIVLWIMDTGAGIAAKIFGVVFPLIAVGLIVFAGMIRVLVSARQLRIKDYVLLIMFWWMPVVNIFLIRKAYKTARREYIIESDRLELETARVNDSVCCTKYPILLVHGIFFRDWQYMNYWGRIPAVLIQNGAKVFYGRQQSALSVPDSAKEVCRAIEEVLAETGAEKVNIIAHSKGGLDSRYAISCLGMDKYVASLTTINTPHKGCDMVDFLLKKVPSSAVKYIENKYNTLFSKLGDNAPDFMAGVNDLSAEKAKTYDSLMPDSPMVSYRSVMSVMSRAGSAGFPLNIGYRLIKKLNGANDGLVWEESAKHGQSFRLVTSPYKRGISHGDIIDLMRENIRGFDVREFYVELVSGLRHEGF